MNTIYLQVHGMRCGGCVKSVTAALQPLPGVQTVEVDLPTGRVTVGGNLPQGSDSLVLALGAVGYPAKLSSAMPAAHVANISSSSCG